MGKDYADHTEVNHDLYKGGDSEDVGYAIGKRQAEQMRRVSSSYLERLVNYVSCGYGEKRFSPSY